MPKQPIPRTCRYGHGALSRLPGEWGLLGFKTRNLSADELVFAGRAGVTAKKMTNVTDENFTLQIHKCPTCGYVELIDLEDD